MEKGLISIIVPIYNTKEYLEKCIQSIINQTYSNIEIILVNNIASEGTKEICEKYKLIDKRIKIVEVTNIGVGEARNIGIKNSIGEYLGFIDSDDYIEKDMYEVLLKNLNKYNADVANIGYTKEENGIIEKRDFSEKVEVLNKREALISLLEAQKIPNYMWNKLFRRKIWNNMWFNEERVFEDVELMYKLFDKVEKVVVIDSLKYIYIQRSTSIMHEPNSTFILDRLHVIIERYNELKDIKDEEIQFMNKYAFAINMIMMFRKTSLENHIHVFEELQKYYELFFNIINQYEEKIRKMITANENLVLDFMLEDLSTAPEKIRSVKDIDK